MISPVSHPFLLLLILNIYKIITPILSNHLTVAEDKKKQVIINKMKAVGKMALFFKTLRKEQENIQELKHMLGVNHLPAGTLQLGSEGIKRGIF